MRVASKEQLFFLSSTMTVLQGSEAGCVNQRVNHECYCKRDLLQIESA